MSSLLPIGTFLIFLYLKLTDVIDWSWLWVTCPLWIGFAFVALMFGFFAAVALCVGARPTFRRR